MTGSDQLDRAFALLEVAAIKGERCPQSKPFGPLTSAQTTALAREGRIRVEIFRHNWRDVTIMVGPHSGKQTAPAPAGSGKPYRVIFKDHVVWNKRSPGIASQQGNGPCERPCRGAAADHLTLAEMLGDGTT